MPWQTPAIWAAAAAATAAVAAGALYWAHPEFLWPASTPAVVADLGGPPAPPQPNPARATSEASPAPAASGGETTAPAKPAFDVVNVAPSGETVVAGRAAPNGKVELRDAGKTVAETTADTAGQFVIIPPALAPGAHTLTLAQVGAGPALQTSNAIEVAVAAPEPKATAAVPTPVAAKASAAPGAAPPPAAPGSSVRVAVQSVEGSSGGRLVAKGAAEPNATVRLYLSGAYVGDAKTGADGRWSLTIEHGVAPGAYSVRADEINPANAAVVGRAEAPFDYSSAHSNPAPAAADRAEAAAAAPSPADLVIDSVTTHHVERGHTLWGISQKFYGDGSRYEIIFAANANQIKNPDLIYPGQVFVVPRPEPRP